MKAITYIISAKSTKNVHGKGYCSTFQSQQEICGLKFET